MEQRVSISHPGQTHCFRAPDLGRWGQVWDVIKWVVDLYAIALCAKSNGLLLPFLSRYEQNAILGKPVLVVFPMVFNSLCWLGSGVSWLSVSYGDMKQTRNI